MSVEDLWNDVAPVTPAEFGIWGAAISKEVDNLPNGITTLPLTAVSPFKIGATTLSDDGGTLVAAGPMVSTQDRINAYAQDMMSNGTLVDDAAQDLGMPRWSLANGVTQRVKWSWEIPAGWDTVAIWLGWDKEAAGSGNVKFQFRYNLVYPLAGTNVDAAAQTLADIPVLAVHGTQYAIKLDTPALLSAIATPEGAFGSRPHMVCSLSRIGADAGDSYTGAVGIAVATMLRVN